MTSTVDIWDFLFAGVSATALSAVGGKLAPVVCPHLGVKVQDCQIPIMVASFIISAYFLMPRAARRVPSKPPHNIPLKDTPAYKKGQHWTCDATKEIEINFPPDGDQSKGNCPPVTMLDMLKKCVEKSGNEVALAIERPTPEKKNKGIAPSLPWSEWTKWTWKDVLKESEYAAAGFIAFGMEMFGSVAAWGFNSPEWHFTAYASAIAGGKLAGVYPTDSRENVVYKIHQSSSIAVVVENVKLLETVKSELKNLPEVRVIVVYDPDVYNSPNFKEEIIENGSAGAVHVISWKKLIETGKRDTRAISELRNNRYQNTKPGHCCDLVYTSGTTGMPKAVMLSHDNVFSTVSNVPIRTQTLTDPMAPGKMYGEQRVLSYLPLSHVAAYLFDIIFPLIISSRLDICPNTKHCTVYFARKYDLSESTIRDRLVFVRPTVFLGVPRVWEKLSEVLKAAGQKAPAPLRMVSNWAKSKMLEHSSNCLLGGSGAYPSKHALASRITGRVRNVLGLDCVQFAATGAAPIMPETLDYFASLGIDIYELYGMSESCAMVTANTCFGRRHGSIGAATPGHEVACLDTLTDPKNPKRVPPTTQKSFKQPSEKEQGEICFRGRSIMMGYLANPKLGAAHVAEIEKKTAESIDENGWLHSGDKGCMDDTGMFRITGRYKELIITAGGENIAPVPIEDWVKSNYTCISNLMMVGDKKKYNTCLITLKCVGASGQDPGSNILLNSVQQELGCKTTEEARNSPKVKEYLEGALKAVNGNAEVVANNASKIQKYYLLPLDFSITTEEFTPTFKLKRSYVMDKYKKEIDSMY